jgi:hypothetical protein
MGWFDTMFEGGAQKQAAAANMLALNNYNVQGNQDLTAAFGPSLAALQPAVSNYANIQQMFSPGVSMMSNALGLNGPGGVSTAQNAFTTSPGYQAGIDQGLQGIARLHSLSGMGQSGNTDIDALKFAQNSQNQQWQNWIQNLQGYTNPMLTAAAGGAGAGTNIANLWQGNAANQIGLLSGLTSGTMAQNNLVAQGEQQGANNLLGGVLGLGKLATTAIPGSSMLGGLGSALSGLLAA